MVSRGRLFDVLDHPGFVAEAGGEWLGYATYQVEGAALEVTVLEALSPRRGVGSALLAACVGVAVEQGLGRVWLVTTNDNLRALRFYQRRDFVLVALRPGAIDEARRTLKPEIGLVGNDDIPIRDELELELPVAAWPGFVEKYSWPT